MLRRVWVGWAAVAIGVLAGCGGGGSGTGGGTTSGTTSETGSTTSSAGPGCGDGKVDPNEKCDDGNTTSGDGCAADCSAVESGFACTGDPSVCTATCGDGIVVGAEACDDGNTAENDGCAADCSKVDDGYTCTGAPSSCTTECGDGIIAGDEVCDDGNTAKNDGCDDACTVEAGFTCDTASPTICTSICGDGKVVGTEKCDDNNTTDGDGCNKDCAEESGYTCTGEPSTCATTCGDGIIAGDELCDDSNAAGNDGCAADCKTTENGWTCSGEPSICATTCGDGIIAGDELCDDTNAMSNDGCAGDCKSVEMGWSCTGPGPCTPVCGDGVMVGNEACDDGNTTAGDGCAADCKAIDTGYTCTGMPSVCVTTCGDGVIAGIEACDDGNTNGTDGCTATCTVSPGWTCTGTPSVCKTTCGDGIVAGTEVCDDSNTANGDGCSAGCNQVELGWTCTGSPSLCVTTCGDGIAVGSETCDDANTAANDGCSPTCATETGYACTGSPSVCGPICGDGMKIAGEKCDDGNTVNGDCCSSTCQLEAGCEVEPNDTDATANDFGSLSIANRIKGRINPTGDKDVYMVTVPAGATANLKAEVKDGPLGTLCSDTTKIDTYLYVRNASATVIGSDEDSGDGFCSLVTVNGLLPGVYFVEVLDTPFYSSTPTTFDYTLEITMQLAICGNGITELAEQCDDANTANGDGCSSLCKLEAKPEVEPNDTCATAGTPLVLPPNKLVSGSLSSSSDADFFAFTLTNYADVQFETFDSNGPSTCATIDTKLELFNSSCTSLGAFVDQGGVGNCSRIGPAVQAYTKHMAPGTYYAKVNGFSAFNYTLLASTIALCGNGVVEGSEECDGTAGCGPDCLIIPVCGNGNRENAEACDDGNTTNGDGCSSTCQWELTPEVEANGTTAEADAALPIITGDKRIVGAIGAAGDVDTFKLSVATQQVVRFEMFDTGGRDCGSSINAVMTLKLLSSTGTTLKQDTPSSSDTTASGIGSNCPALVVDLAPGTYYIQTARSTSGTLAAYHLQIKYENNGGNEAEPNDTRAQANNVVGSDVYYFADHQVGTDVDYFAITIPPGGTRSLRIDAIEGDSVKTCEGNFIDTYLTLYNSAGTSLVTDDDDGRGFCSVLDGTGASPRDSALHNMAAGTYYVEVKRAPFFTAPADVFNYKLVFVLRQ